MIRSARSCRIGPIDVSRFGLIYAGAQKNLGPSGVTLVIIREDLLERSEKSLPTMLSYKVMADNNSLYNTPNTFGIYIFGLVMQWLKSLGGLQAIHRLNQRKATLLYSEIDRTGFYRGTAQKESRSLMNITFRLPSEELEKTFDRQASAAGHGFEIAIGAFDQSDHRVTHLLQVLDVGAGSDVQVQADQIEPIAIDALEGQVQVFVPDAVLAAFAAGVHLFAVPVAKPRVEAQPHRVTG